MSTHSNIKIGIIQFPGSNTERETFMACTRAGMEPVEFLWNNDPVELSKLDGYIIVGGFSYEDRSRAGVIAALDPIMKQISIESEKNKPVLGICNGAQILVESGLVPGFKNNQIGIALTDNKRVKKLLGAGITNYLDLTEVDELLPYETLLNREAELIGMTINYKTDITIIGDKESEIRLKWSNADIIYIHESNNITIKNIIVESICGAYTD